jgi:NodT family efflux transporter outer membrane factor (OMF) lipoprotein
MFLLMFGCKLPRMSEAPTLRTMPTGWDGVTDTIGSPRGLFRHDPLLAALIDTVLANNPDLRIANERIRMAGAVAAQARGMMLPQVNAGVTPSLRKFGLYTMDGAGNIVTEMEKGKLIPIDLPDFMLGMQASWEADLWGKLRDRKAAALARFMASESARQLIRTALVADAASAYYELVAADQELRMLDQTIALQEEALSLVRVQKEASVVNQLAVQQFEAQLLDQQGLRIQVKQLIVDTEARINALAGRFNVPIPRDTAFFSNKALTPVKPGIPARMIEFRPDIRQVAYELTAARADLEAARKAFLPSLMITGSTALQAYRPGALLFFPESIAYSLISGFTGPIINRNQIAGEFTRADALRREAMFNYQSKVSQAFLEVQQELKRFDNLQTIFDLKRKESGILLDAVDVSRELFRYGRADYIEVLLARQNALRVNMELIESRRMQFLTAVKLYRALGGD